LVPGALQQSFLHQPIVLVVLHDVADGHSSKAEPHVAHQLILLRDVEDLGKLPRKSRVGRSAKTSFCYF